MYAIFFIKKTHIYYIIGHKNTQYIVCSGAIVRYSIYFSSFSGKQPFIVIQNISLRLFLIKQLIPQPIVGIYRKPHKEKPRYCHKKADLSVKIVWHRTIVPNVAVKDYIEHIAGNEFDYIGG